jgi:hypothetical protein
LPVAAPYRSAAHAKSFSAWAMLPATNPLAQLISRSSKEV